MIPLIYSQQDEASLSIGNFIKESYSVGDSGVINGKYGDFILMGIRERHLYIDAETIVSGIAGSEKIEGIVFLSRHSSSASISSMTVHATGNISDAKLGGKPKTLSVAMPDLMTETLRNMHANNKRKEIQVTYESTHHGPYCPNPCFYLEIGTTAREWTDKEILGTVVSSLLSSEKNGYGNFVGVGGGHYAPKFTGYVLGEKINIGHIIPKYHGNAITREILEQSIEKTPGFKGMVMDFKGCNSDMRTLVRQLSSEIGCELIEI
ncbi:MAG: D-tyrosyl-tRNA(Tyr) deacylase [Candidatus Thermoplasmatota archaeon]|nr:D-tyrosyl-tRNA(Tyr) deacylase [Candidatus Thermoplasmatota archaeon]MCL5730901.1 D-tyrosyl-tRNA(Tyr) deacylase [Candidatus Thermoplasmatota archaeon]